METILKGNLRDICVMHVCLEIGNKIVDMHVYIVRNRKPICGANGIARVISLITVFSESRTWQNYRF